MWTVAIFLASIASLGAATTRGFGRVGSSAQNGETSEESDDTILAMGLELLEPSQETKDYLVARLPDWMLPASWRAGGGPIGVGWGSGRLSFCELNDNDCEETPPLVPPPKPYNGGAIEKRTSKLRAPTSRPASRKLE
jgi:hypothetical protein